MGRNIKPLFNYHPPATEEEIRGASLVTSAAPRDRDVEAARASALAAKRFGVT